MEIERQKQEDLSRRYRRVSTNTKLCHYCNVEIPTDVKSCPNCHKIQHKFRRGKIIAFLTFTFLAYVFISQKNAANGENNIYLGFTCLLLAIFSFLSIIYERNKERKSIKIFENTNAIFSNIKQSNDLLPNGNTIAEQQLIDYQIAIGNYPDGTPMYCDMRIVSSTIPPSPDYAQLNTDEKKFFSALSKKLIESGYDPARIKLTRLSDGTFNVDHIDLCYIGKICLYKKPDSYAVIKKGNKKATKIFSDHKQAKIFAAQNENYEIKTRSTHFSTYMQYLVGSDVIKHMHDPSLQQCIDTIPKWIRYLNYCKKT